MSDRAQGLLSAEMALLGAALLDPRLVETLTVTDDDFLYPNLAEVYACVKRQFSQNGASDIVTVKAELGDSDGLVDTMVRAMESVTSVSLAPAYEKTVKDAAYVRRFHEWQSSLESAETPDEIESIVTKRPTYDSSRPLLGIRDVEMPTYDKGVKTGFAGLDYITHGAGFVSGQVTVASAYHKIGKTAALTQFCRAGAESVDNVVYGTFADLDPKRLLQRMLMQACGSRYVTDSMEAAELGTIKRLPISFYWSKLHGRAVEDFCAKMRNLAYKRPVGAVYLDYAQKLRARKECGSMEREQSYIVAELCDLAEDLDCPIVVGSQITRDKETGSSITKHSRAWEEEAGMVVRIERNKETDEARFDVPFNRHGPERNVPLTWNDRHVRFDEPVANMMK